MQHLWLIPALPLLGFLLNGLFGKRFPKRAIDAVAVGSVFFSLLWVIKVLASAGDLVNPLTERYFEWIASGDLSIPFSLALDRLTAVMLGVVTGIGFLIHVYATGYMAHEEGYYRFFAYLNLFMFFMLLLVLAANFLLLFVGWEGVGLCSYLLIGFYFKKPSATTAGNKAFIVNRIGDFGFMLAIFLIFITFGSLDFAKVFSSLSSLPPERDGGLLTAIALLLFVGATGKSAQIPLYVWLPDAMEGPTPVSALIHAATMVTAGVYLIARCAVLYEAAPLAAATVAWIGLATAVMAATIGITQFDIKKVFAYSTVSQLGYMFLAVGSGAFSAGIYHLMTHAFFKALLFLGAGSVIHALAGEQDIRNMGGLAKKIPITFYTLMAAGLAIAGFPFTSGFFSKDEILLAVHEVSPLMFWIGVITAGITAFYVFRCLFLTFFGEPRGHHHPHESPPSMTVPLILLALLSLGGGFIKVPHILTPVLPHEELPHDPLLVVIASSAGLIGIALAYLMYVAKPELAPAAANALGRLYRLVYNKYYVDELYQAAVVNPTIRASQVGLWKGVDVGFIDTVVNGAGELARAIGGGLRLMQSGFVRSYAVWVVAGAMVIVLAVGVWGGGAR